VFRWNSTTNKIDVKVCEGGFFVYFENLFQVELVIYLDLKLAFFLFQFIV